jgi:signal transduction histidine kinase
VLTNLLSNAFKYSPSDGTVRLAATIEPRAARITVADEGIGIPPDEAGRLFEPFHRCSNATGFEGTGLGLAVVKRSLDAHGGTIEVASALGRGTTVSVAVPLAEEATG